MTPRHVVGFFVPFASSATAGATFPQQLAIAAVSGLFGVIGVTAGAYISRQRRPRPRLRKKPRRDHEQ